MFTGTYRWGRVRTNWRLPQNANSESPGRWETWTCHQNTKLTKWPFNGYYISGLPLWWITADHLLLRLADLQAAGWFSQPLLINNPVTARWCALCVPINSRKLNTNTHPWNIGIAVIAAVHVSFDIILSYVENCSWFELNYICYNFESVISLCVL